MGENSKIEWTDHTFNPWIGCMKVSPGCKNCYASVNTFTRAQRSRGRELWGPASTTERHVTSEAKWREPVKWNAAAEREGVRKRVFCASMADVFEDHPMLPPLRARLWDVIGATPWLDWQLLTKRPENVVSMMGWGHFPRNVWIGTSAEDQERWDERIPHLLRVPAYTVFVSAEPLLGPIDCGDALEGIEWLIVGGESGAGARPFRAEWARDLIAQGHAAGSAVFVKQMGSGLRNFAPGKRYVRDGLTAFQIHDAKGGDWSEWPADLRVRQMPASAA